MAQEMDPAQMREFLAGRRLNVSDLTKKAATIDKKERERLRDLAIAKRVSCQLETEN